MEMFPSSMKIPQKDGLSYTDKTKIIGGECNLLYMVWMSYKNLYYKTESAG